MDEGDDGSLTTAAIFSTKLGTGSPLGNQGGLVLSEDSRWLLVVNAGSNDVSVFRVNHDSTDNHLLTLADRSSSGGVTPVSVTINDERVYVLNAGTSSTPGNIAGFYLNDDDGTLSPIPGSIEPLSGITQPAEISFNPLGTVLVVTEKSHRHLHRERRWSRIRSHHNPL